jgi:hypothetical protein
MEDGTPSLRKPEFVFNHPSAQRIAIEICMDFGDIMGDETHGQQHPCGGSASDAAADELVLPMQLVRANVRLNGT